MSVSVSSVAPPAPAAARPRTTVFPPPSKRLPPPTSSYAHDVRLEKRLQDAEAKLAEHADRVPVIVELAPRSALSLDKRKFLVPRTITVAQFLWSLRRRIQLKPEEALFLFVNNTLPPSSVLMDQLYADHQAHDRFLYLTLSPETTFGAAVSQ